MANKRRKMYFRMVTSSLIRRASRLVIAVLAVAIGATILSGLVTIYYDIPRQLGREFRSYGANLLLLPKGDARISREDLERVRALIGPERIVGMAPYRYQTVKINSSPTSSPAPTCRRRRRTVPSGTWKATGAAPPRPAG